MKFSIKYIALLVIVLAVSSCESETIKKDKVIAEQEKIQAALQKQLDEEFGEYAEEVKPGDREYYKAYDKALTLWKVPFREINIQTSFGNAHLIVSGPKNAEPVVLLLIGDHDIITRRAWKKQKNCYHTSKQLL